MGGVETTLSVAEEILLYAERNVLRLLDALSFYRVNDPADSDSALEAMISWFKEANRSAVSWLSCHHAFSDNIVGVSWGRSARGLGRQRTRGRTRRGVRQGVFQALRA